MVINLHLEIVNLMPKYKIIQNLKYLQYLQELPTTNSYFITNM